MFIYIDILRAQELVIGSSLINRDLLGSDYGEYDSKSGTTNH
jgi:hypothetical protein